MKATNLTLPEFAFLDDPALHGRNVILHIRSASVVEILEANETCLAPNVISKHFTYRDRYGFDEKMVAALHHAPLLSDYSRDEIIAQVLDPVIEYYKRDCDSMDKSAFN